MGDIGIEHPPLTLSRGPISAEGGAKSDAHGAPDPTHYPDLAEVIKAWPKLPEHIKVAVMALVQSARGQEIER